MNIKYCKSFWGYYRFDKQFKFIKLFLENCRMRSDVASSPYVPSDKQKSQRVHTYETNTVQGLRSQGQKYLKGMQSPQYLKQYNTYSYKGFHSRGQTPERDQQYQTVQELKSENSKLKKLVKETQAKRIQVTKQCSELAAKNEKLEQQNASLAKKLREWKDSQSGDKFQYEQLKFLNKQLHIEIEQLHKNNQQLNQRLRYQTDNISRKYHQLQDRTLKNIQLALKRLKKSVSYLSSLSAKDIEKTKEIQVENLRKCIEILKGKYTPSESDDKQIQDLMSPIINIQSELHQRNKDISFLKQQNQRLSSELRKCKKTQKQILPQYKDTLQKLKKNLGILRERISQHQYQKVRLVREFSQKQKMLGEQMEMLVKQNRKLKLQNKLFEKRVQQMQDDVQEERERLMGENQMLRKICGGGQGGEDGGIGGGEEEGGEEEEESYGYKTVGYRFGRGKGDGFTGGREFEGASVDEREYDVKSNNEGKTASFLKKNYSANQLRVSRSKQHKQTIEAYKKLRDSREKPAQIQRPSKMQAQPQLQTHIQNLKLAFEQSGYNPKTKREKGEKVQKYERISLHRQKAQKQQYQIDNDSDEQYINFNKDQFNQDSSMGQVSQDGIKNQIFKIDQEIMQIQKTLDRELNMYK